MSASAYALDTKQITDGDLVSVPTGPTRAAGPIAPRSQVAAKSAIDRYRHYDMPGWDGEEAEPITRETCDAATRFCESLPRNIPEPAVGPSTDGTIGFQWIEPGGAIAGIFVEIGPGATIAAYIEGLDGVALLRLPRKNLGVGGYEMKHFFESLAGE